MMMLSHDHQPQAFTLIEFYPFISNANQHGIMNRANKAIRSNDDVSFPIKNNLDINSSHEPVHFQKRKFSPEEDLILKREIALHGPRKWDKIALSLPGRTGRQCRDRFHNYLNPTLTNGPWTKEEDKLLEEKVSEIGQHWNKIIRFFRGRSTNNVKNRWYTYISKQKKDEFQTLSGKNTNKNRQIAGYHEDEENSDTNNNQKTDYFNSNNNDNENYENNFSLKFENQPILNSIDCPNKESGKVLNLSENLSDDVVLPKNKNMNKILFPPIYPPNNTFIFPSNIGLFDFLSHEVGT